MIFNISEMKYIAIKKQNWKIVAVVMQVLCPRVWNSGSVGLQPQKQVWICTSVVSHEEAASEHG